MIFTCMFALKILNFGIMALKSFFENCLFKVFKYMLSYLNSRIINHTLLLQLYIIGSNTVIVITKNVSHLKIHVVI